ncbi:MAG: heme ABC transporter substrate-binding protein IsdE [Oscillospiraceae bacterium]|nr:heme ABC transporter substrate-binding protein IsdE [Oscillospiraceae bacterium]
MRRLSSFVAAAATLACLTMLAHGCVNQHPAQSGSAAPAEAYRLIASSRAAVEICDKLELDLVGRPALDGLPARYDGLPETGSPMAPDFEAIRLLAPTEVIGPDTLEYDLADGFKNAGLPATFLNLRSVAGLYESIEYLGGKYGKSDRADELISEYRRTLARLDEARGDRESPTVLILMGLPGAYIQCTASSYAGSLIEMGGGINVVTDPNEDFVSWNTEALLELDPDIIVRTAHALPDLVADMFAKEFEENDIWKHFRAVQEGRVYDLDYTVFGMSANFRWPEAFDEMAVIFWPDEN